MVDRPARPRTQKVAHLSETSQRCTGARSEAPSPPPKRPLEKVEDEEDEQEPASKRPRDDRISSPSSNFTQPSVEAQAVTAKEEPGAADFEPLGAVVDRNEGGEEAIEEDAFEGGMEEEVNHRDSLDTVLIKPEIVDRACKEEEVDQDSFRDDEVEQVEEQSTPAISTSVLGKVVDFVKGLWW